MQYNRNLIFLRHRVSCVLVTVIFKLGIRFKRKSVKHLANKTSTAMSDLLVKKDLYKVKLLCFQRCFTIFCSVFRYCFKLNMQLTWSHQWTQTESTLTDQLLSSI